MIDFLIMYEIKTRELESIVLLGDELKKRGYSVEYLSFEHVNLKKYLQNKKYIDKYYNNVNVVITPSLYHDKEVYNLVYYVCGKCKNIVNLRWEQSYTFKEEEDLDNYYYPHGDAKLGYHVCWGRETHTNFLKSGVAEEKLILSGPIHMDFLRPEFKEYYYNKTKLFSKYNIPLDKKTVLYISSFAISTMTDRQIQLEEEVTGQSLYNNKVSRDRESQRLTFEWIEELLKKNNCYFIYRPHPVENSVDKLKYLEDKYENFKVIFDYSVKQWIINCDIITTWMSTSIAEAFFANKSCSIVRPLPFAREDEVTIYKDAKIITSKSEFLENIFKDEYTSVSKKVITSYYNVTDVPSYIRLSNKLEEIYSSEYLFNWDEQKINSFNRKKWHFILQSLLLYIYIPTINFLGKIRAKFNFSFGKRINGRVDSFRKSLSSIDRKLIKDEEFEEVSNKLKKILIDK